MVAKYSDSRSPSAMSVINKAEELAVYILRVCSNENNETLQKYGILIDAICESCLTTAMYTAQAIAIPLTSKESYRFAREIQRYITAELAALEELFVIAIRLYAFKNSSYVSALYTNLAGAFTLWIRNLNRQFSRFMSKQAEKEKKKAKDRTDNDKDNTIEEHVVSDIQIPEELAAEIESDGTPSDELIQRAIAKADAAEAIANESPKKRSKSVKKIIKTAASMKLYSAKMLDDTGTAQTVQIPIPSDIFDDYEDREALDDSISIFEEMRDSIYAPVYSKNSMPLQSSDLKHHLTIVKRDRKYKDLKNHRLMDLLQDMDPYEPQVGDMLLELAETTPDRDEEGFYILRKKDQT